MRSKVVGGAGDGGAGNGGAVAGIPTVPLFPDLTKTTGAVSPKADASDRRRTFRREILYVVLMSRALRPRCWR